MMAKIRKQVVTNLTNQAYKNLEARKDNIFLLNQNSIDNLINKIMGRCLIAFEQIMIQPENTKLIGQRIFEKCQEIVVDLLSNINLPNKDGLKKQLIHHVAEYLFVLKELRQNNLFNKINFLIHRKKLWDIELSSIAIYWNFLVKNQQFSRLFEQKIRLIYKNRLKLTI